MFTLLKRIKFSSVIGSSSSSKQGLLLRSHSSSSSTITPPLNRRRRWTTDNPMRPDTSTSDFISGVAVTGLWGLLSVVLGMLWLVRNSENGTPYLILADPRKPPPEEYWDWTLIGLEWKYILEGVKIYGKPLYTRRPGELTVHMYRQQLEEKHNEEKKRRKKKKFE